jgi:hypothetical protein
MKNKELDMEETIKSDDDSEDFLIEEHSDDSSIGEEIDDLINNKYEESGIIYIIDICIFIIIVGITIGKISYMYYIL